MQTEVQRQLTAIGKKTYFKEVIEKLTLNRELSHEESTYILSAAVLFIREYEADKNLVSYADLAYYIFLKYSVNTGDYRPLYDFALNFGFYPIVKTILSNDLLGHLSMSDYAVESLLDNYAHPFLKYIETLSQSQERKSFINDFSFEKSFIAPTSFGKSTTILEYLNSFDYKNAKVAIIVPTKSLLVQTYQMIKNGNQFNTSIIIHDDMYDGKSKFIGVFTQERALRMLKKGVIFDVIILDEAHLIFENDRGVLISRLINQNGQQNRDQKIAYLSPLIKDSENLKVNSTQNITQHHVLFNLKEPEFFEYKVPTKEVYKYNRFVNQYYVIEQGVDDSYLDYIRRNGKDKNLIFENNPHKIELLSKNLCEILPEPTEELLGQIADLKDVLRDKVHEDYFAINYLNRGVIYLHGQLPNLIKEYLEEKYKTVPALKYLVANTVILEGMNFPTDTLFICGSARSISNGKSLLNLVGRVNRLNKIFNGYKTENLKELLPQVHIISDKEKGHDSKFKYLRSRVFDDLIKNPILESFDIDKVGPSKSQTEARERFIERTKKVQQYEKFLYTEPNDEKDVIKKYFIENGISNYYFEIDSLVDFFEKGKNAIQQNGQVWRGLTMMQKIAKIFINDTNNVYDYEFRRIKNEPAQKYYDGYFQVAMVRSLKENIKWQVDHFKDVVNNPSFPQKKVYIGESYADTAWVSEDNVESKRKVFIRLDNKNQQELVNIAIVKLQIEENFAGFTLNKFIRALYDFELISEDDFNLYTYGTKDLEKIELQKQGLSLNLIGRLSDDEQLKNITKDQHGNLSGNDEFNSFLNKIDDFYRFEIKRYIA